MTSVDNSSLSLLVAILVPLAAGLVLLFGARFSTATRRVIAALGFGWPLLIGLLLYSRFEPCLDGGYNFELCLPTGLQAVGIFLHLGLNGLSMPLFLLAGVVGLAAGVYAMFSMPSAHTCTWPCCCSCSAD